MLVPGSCLVFYKRSFESEPVLLARSLQPGFIAQAPPSVRMASLRPNPSHRAYPIQLLRTEPEPSCEGEEVRAPAAQRPAFRTYKARKGDTLEKIARRNKLDVKLLCQLNGIKKTAPTEIRAKR